MKIKSIRVQNNGYVHCRSNFYSAHDLFPGDSAFVFSGGVNRLVGEIDSGNWAVSYLLSMYQYRPKDFVLFDRPEVVIDHKVVLLKELSKHTCYMDQLDPLFSGHASVKKLVIQGLKHSNLNYSSDDIRNLFCIDNERFERPLSGVGNEIFKAMAAIGLSNEKEIFCFPWMSVMRFDGYHKSLTFALEKLSELEKIIILPVGRGKNGDNSLS
ncbi:MAG: hypothetical protein E7580_08960 [Ruminococcaceae bacterium]|nr:hypothetical protein [Oscillospiraceae bacterium]